MPTESNLSRRKTWQTSFNNKPVKRVKVDHHCQGLESDYSTSIIPPDQKDMVEVSSCMKIWEVTLDKGPLKRDQVHVGTGL